MARGATGSVSERQQLWAEGNRFWLLRGHEGVCFLFLERNAPEGFRGPGRGSSQDLLKEDKLAVVKAKKEEKELARAINKAEKKDAAIAKFDKLKRLTGPATELPRNMGCNQRQA